MEILEELRQWKDEVAELRRKNIDLEITLREKVEQFFSLERSLDNMKVKINDDDSRFDMMLTEKDTIISSLQKEIEILKQGKPHLSEGKSVETSEYEENVLSNIPCVQLKQSEKSENDSHDEKPEEVDSRLVFLENELLARHIRLEEAETQARTTQLENEKLLSKMNLMEQLLDTTRATRDALLSKTKLRMPESHFSTTKPPFSFSNFDASCLNKTPVEEDDNLIVDDESFMFVDGNLMMHRLREMEDLLDHLRGSSSIHTLSQQQEQQEQQQQVATSQQHKGQMLLSHPLLKEQQINSNSARGSRNRSFVSLHEELLDSSRAHHKVVSRNHSMTKLVSARSQLSSSSEENESKSKISSHRNKNSNIPSGSFLSPHHQINKVLSSSDDMTSSSSDDEMSSSTNSEREEGGASNLLSRLSIVRTAPPRTSKPSPVPLLPLPGASERERERILHLEKLLAAHEKQIQQLKTELATRPPVLDLVSSRPAAPLKSAIALRTTTPSTSNVGTVSSPANQMTNNPPGGINFLVEETASKISGIAQKLESASFAVSQATNRLSSFVEKLRTPRGDTSNSGVASLFGPDGTLLPLYRPLPQNPVSAANPLLSIDTCSVVLPLHESGKVSGSVGVSKTFSLLPARTFASSSKDATAASEDDGSGTDDEEKRNLLLKFYDETYQQVAHAVLAQGSHEKEEMRNSMSSLPALMKPSLPSVTTTETETTSPGSHADTFSGSQMLSPTFNQQTSHQNEFSLKLQLPPRAGPHFEIESAAALHAKLDVLLDQVKSLQQQHTANSPSAAQQMVVSHSNPVVCVTSPSKTRQELFFGKIDEQDHNSNSTLVPVRSANREGLSLKESAALVRAQLSERKEKRAVRKQQHQSLLSNSTAENKLFEKTPSETAVSSSLGTSHSGLINDLTSANGGSGFVWSWG
eukprot:GDKJ01018035.1.p1 GENE.GDKJ01018035.1~~GDKJ01018035.1.p1  ORF type:complete len:956 (+),score=265.10 GDKJ01018035.1:98-2869(+)